MKYCERVFRHLYIIPNGNVFLCSWNTKPIGNILKQDLKQIWNSDEAEKIRDSIRDGSFQYCKKTGCPFCENNTLKEVGGGKKVVKNSLFPLIILMSLIVL